MGKISSSNMPIDRRPHHEIMQSFFASSPCQHFAVGTRVVCNNVGGEILRESLDGGRFLVVRWDNGAHTNIPNPNNRSN